MDNKNGLIEKIKGQGLQKLFSLIALVVLILVFSLLGQNFFSKESFVNILDSSYYIGFMAIGVTFVIITGGMDLSIGTVMMCSALLGGVAYNVWGWSIGMALALIVVVATLFGLVNGILIAKLKLPPFIATMGTMLISQGLGSIIAKVQTQRYPTAYEEAGWFKSVFFKTEGGFPMGIIFLAIFFIVAFIILNKTRIGRYAFAIGSNEEAVRLSGVNVDKWKIMVYVISGFFAGLGGIMYAATYTTIIPGTGNGIELQAIAAVVIGGTSLAGGIGSITGTIIGVYVMSVLKNGLMSMNLQGQWQVFFTGVVVICAVLIDIYRNKKANEVKKDKKESKKVREVKSTSGALKQ
ncbi:ABC transporter permease [Clostridium sp. NSJ-49]|jgi:ribose transport system permease protein|uniref:Monosaccharide-transporting ATPase n=1 Tax=Clostridium disporicum TaxID=84024 RepID=A0A174GUT7_9CLOT|nr:MULTISPECIES: ABC transporter permease [Clostridium]MBC5624061.1 ABC transporter permease [Clostridium sp. NSJ-49]MCD2502265.1 ABC transporter permease [Clostridium sp. NSJ-145]CUO66283.1 monosaccharide-transporting ATPase [Clostridium disporicum]